MRFPEFKGVWTLDEIENIVSNKSQKYVPSSNEHIADIELENMMEGGGITYPLADSSMQKSTKNRFSSGNVLYGKLRPYLNKVWKANFDGVCSSEIWVLSSLNLDSDFLYSFCQTPYFKSLANTTCGSKMPKADWDLISSSLIKFPEDEEQKRIGNLMLKLDQKIENQRKTIEDYQKLFDGTLEKLLQTDECFDEMSLESAIENHLIRTVKVNELKPFLGKLTYLSTSSIIGSEIVSNEGLVSFLDRPSRACMSPIPNSVWFAKMKDSIKVYLASSEDQNKYILSTGFYGIVSLSPRISSKWLMMLFLSKFFNDQKDKFSEGSSMSGIKDNQFSDIKIKVFKNIENQDKSVAFLKSLHEVMEINKLHLWSLQKLKKFLLNSLFI